MGISGKGNSQAKTSSASTTSTVNNIDNTINQSDFGAVDRAFSFGDTVVRALSDGVSDVVDAVGDANREGLDFGREALDFGRDAIGSNEETLRNAFDFGRELTEGSASFAENIFESSLKTVTGVLAEGQMQLGNTVSNLNAIARQNSTSADERVAGLAKYAILGVGGVVAVIALALILRDGR